MANFKPNVPLSHLTFTQILAKFDHSVTFQISTKKATTSSYPLPPYSSPTPAPSDITCESALSPRPISNNLLGFQPITAHLKGGDLRLLLLDKTNKNSFELFGQHHESRDHCLNNLIVHLKFWKVSPVAPFRNSCHNLLTAPGIRHHNIRQKGPTLPTYQKFYAACLLECPFLLLPVCADRNIRKLCKHIMETLKGIEKEHFVYFRSI